MYMSNYCNLLLTYSLIASLSITSLWRTSLVPIPLIGAGIATPLTFSSSLSASKGFTSAYLSPSIALKTSLANLYGLAVETTTLENYLATEFSSYELAEKLNSDENINFTDIVEVSNADIEAYFEDNQNLENYLSE